MGTNCFPRQGSSSVSRIGTILPHDYLTPLLGPEADPVQAGVRLHELAQEPTLDAGVMLAELCRNRETLATSDPAILGGLLRLVHLTALRTGVAAEGGIEADSVTGVLEALPQPTPNTHLLLQLLSMDRGRESLTALASAIPIHPPRDWMEAGHLLSPLMQNDDWPIDAVFPALLELLDRPPLAAPVLDLANYVTRVGRTPTHPAADRVATLDALLGEIAHRLDRFEEDPRSFGDDVTEVQSRLGEAVALAVSLCDALGIIGDRSAIGSLNRTVELRHRRVQCEAAGALARLGEQSGEQRLIELTAEPAARLRAIHYLDELGLGNRVDPRWRDESATAEAEMALWLSQPQQMGVPPTSVEVIASRRMMWPSFEEPVDVRLVRFEYSFGDQRYSNVGMTGPAVFALSADVADLPNEDIYAIYAGWQAEHPEIFTVPADQLNEAQRRLIDPLTRHLDRSEYESIEPELLGFFLDEHAGVFRAVRDGTTCRVVTDGLETIDQAVEGRMRPLGAAELFHLFKGRKMLRTFNA